MSGLPTVSANIHFMLRSDDLDGEENVKYTAPKDVTDFIKHCPGMLIHSKDVRDVQADQMEALQKEHEELMQRMEQDKREMSRQLESQRQAVAAAEARAREAQERARREAKEAQKQASERVAEAKRCAEQAQRQAEEAKKEVKESQRQADLRAEKMEAKRQEERRQAQRKAEQAQKQADSKKAEAQRQEELQQAQRQAAEQARRQAQEAERQAALRAEREKAQRREEERTRLAIQEILTDMIAGFAQQKHKTEQWWLSSKRNELAKEAAVNNHNDAIRIRSHAKGRNDVLAQLADRSRHVEIWKGKFAAWGGHDHEYASYVHGEGQKIYDDAIQQIKSLA